MGLGTRRIVAGIGRTALAAGTALLFTACGGSNEGEQHHSTSDGPTVVAASAWEGAFAKAAGAKNVTVIVPAGVKHAPDYDPKPSDLIAVGKAQFVLYAEFEGFAGRIKEAAGSDAKTVSVTLDNSPANVAVEVRRLAGLFGTTPAAEKWLGEFDAQYRTLSAEFRAARHGRARPVVVTQAFTTWAAQLADAEVVGTYGPAEVTASQLADLSARHPQFVLDNAQMSLGAVLPGSTAEQLSISNYPGSDMDLLSIYHAASSTLAAALRE